MLLRMWFRERCARAFGARVEAAEMIAGVPSAGAGWKMA